MAKINQTYKIFTNCGNLKKDIPLKEVFSSLQTNKIGEVIGKGGSTIKSITEKTETNIDINDNGDISIYGRSKESRQEALNIIESMISDPEIGSFLTTICSLQPTNHMITAPKIIPLINEIQNP